MDAYIGQTQLYGRWHEHGDYTDGKWMPRPRLTESLTFVHIRIGQSHQMARIFSTARPLDSKVIDPNLSKLHPSLYQHLELMHTRVTDKDSKSDKFIPVSRCIFRVLNQALAESIQKCYRFCQLSPYMVTLCGRYYRRLFSVCLLLHQFQYVLIYIYVGLLYSA
jgi:hypothetical protein